MKVKLFLIRFQGRPPVYSSFTPRPRPGVFPPLALLIGGDLTAAHFTTSEFQLHASSWPASSLARIQLFPMSLSPAHPSFMYFI